MPYWEITKEIEWDMAHRVPNHNGKCRNLHGHRYLLRVTLCGKKLKTEGPEEGMLLDFAKIKDILTIIKMRYDHGTCLDSHDPLTDAFLSQAGQDKLNTLASIDRDGPYVIAESTEPLVMTSLPVGKLIVMHGPPTAEKLVEDIARLVGSLLSGCHLSSVELYETPTSKAVYRCGV